MRAVKPLVWAMAIALCFTLSQAAFALGPTGVVNYDFSEGSGTTPQDTSPNGNDGAIDPTLATIGGGTFGVSGRINTGLKLNGVDDWAQFQSEDFDPSASGTYSFWVNLVTSPATRQAFLGIEANGTKFEIASSSLLNARPSGTINDEILQSSGTLATANWYNIQMTWNHNGGMSTTGVMNVYVNGTEITYNASSTSAITGWTPESLANLVVTLGRRTDAVDRYLGATIDDVAFYSTALSTSDLTLIRTATNGAAALTTNQVVHWNLDDTAGTTIAPSNGGAVAIDLIVGVDNTAVTYLPGGGPTLVGGSYAAAQTLDAVRFSGVQNTTNHIRIDDSPTMDFDKTQGSVVVWVNLHNQFNRMGILRDTTGEMSFEIHSNGRVFFQIGSAVSRTEGTQNAPFIADNTWVHLAFVWDNTAALTADIMQIYLNGTLAANDSAFFGAEGTFVVPANTGDWLIGHRPGILNRNFDGWMADFAMFDVALTAAEIEDIILNGALPTWTPVQEPQPQPQPQPQPGTTGGGGGAVPEPASLVLLGLSALAVMRRRRQ